MTVRALWVYGKPSRVGVPRAGCRWRGLYRAPPGRVVTVGGVRVVVATAEPFGAYHLTALSEEMAARTGVDFIHLLPYPTYTQGWSAARPVADLSVLSDARRLVLSGGGLTPWTHAVACFSRSLGLEVFMMELAYGVCDPQPFVPDAFAAMSSSGAELMSQSFGVPVGCIPVLGNPQLDVLSEWSASNSWLSPTPGPTLVVSTSELPSRDPSGTLRAIARDLVSVGVEVCVAPHPREDVSYWAGFTLGRVQDLAASCSVALGYAGSVWPYLAAAGVPVVGVSSGTTLEGLPPGIIDLASAWVSSPEGFDVEVLRSACPASPSATEHVCGPRGSAAKAVVDFFVS